MTPFELGIRTAQQRNVPGHLKQAYAKGFAGAWEKRAVITSKTLFRDHVADAAVADTEYPLYVRNGEIVDGAHRLAKLIANEEREANAIDVSKALPPARLNEDDSYVGQVYSDDEHSYAVDRIREYVRNHNLTHHKIRTTQLEKANPRPWGKELPLSEVIAALVRRKAQQKNAGYCR